jgi:hypothetical protein
VVHSQFLIKELVLLPKTHSHHNGIHYVMMKFKVSCKVQGVIFRKYTKAKADELGLTGWCRKLLA